MKKSLASIDAKDVALIDEGLLKSKIYTIRGVKVMLDADLAEIYGYETRFFNLQVKNNLEKFDEDFRFQLTKREYLEIQNFGKLVANSRPIPPIRKSTAWRKSPSCKLNARKCTTR